ncbi:glycine decarboxylase subunit H [Ascoidea rubescens DSM 1968]|uniref:Glycine cleavage system H protein n=1 Tax=Ascoidea rubescens DSM 1968 TaxID=1344418 RepID=A0A1D2VRW6_9ASCO|nr:glycine cleavage system H protein [Ascoidea rubescens DSM 1968]ODV64328.1 glycine cleavage system H protein [Ascoidea rubescens DSM 1968]
MISSAVGRSIQRNTFSPLLKNQSFVKPSQFFLKSSINSNNFNNFNYNSFSISKRFNSSDSSLNVLNKSSLPFTYSDGPVTLRFTPEHEWVAFHPDGTSFIGITKHASHAVGDITFVELPSIDTDAVKGEVLGSVESVKSANDVYFPVNGNVVDVNSPLEDDPSPVSTDAMGDGWLVKVDLVDLEGTQKDTELMTEEAYKNFLENEEH